MVKGVSKSGTFASKIALPESDLLSRVGAFLPEIEKANKELEELPKDASMRVDLELKSDNENGDENDSDGSSSDSDDESSDDDGEFLIKKSNAKKATTNNNFKADDENDDTSGDDNDEGGDSKKSDETQNRKQLPTIEFKLTLGALGGIPVMDLLGSNTGETKEDDENDDNKFEAEDADEDDSNQSHTAISNLLSSGKRKRDNERPNKGPLITEIS